jgi:hypothetical protein
VTTDACGEQDVHRFIAEGRDDPSFLTHIRQRHGMSVLTEPCVLDLTSGPDDHTKIGCRLGHLFAHAGMTACMRAWCKMVGMVENMPHHITMGHVASYQGHVETLTAWIEDGGDIHARTAHGITIGHAALMPGYMTISGRKITETHVFDLRPSTKCVEAWIHAGGDASIPMANGDTMMHLAAAVGDEASLRVMAHAKVPLSPQNGFGFTPGHTALHHSHEMWCKAWIRSGGDGSMMDHHGYSLGHIAMSMRQHEFIVDWIHMGGSFHMADHEGVCVPYMSGRLAPDEDLEFAVRHGFNPWFGKVRSGVDRDDMIRSMLAHGCSRVGSSYDDPSRLPPTLWVVWQCMALKDCPTRQRPDAWHAMMERDGIRAYATGLTDTMDDPLLMATWITWLEQDP